MPARKGHNPKRCIQTAESLGNLDLDDLVSRIRYTGSPYHKRNPSDFGLTPPSAPRPGKTLCDGDGEVNLKKTDALRLLQMGVRLGLISIQMNNGLPQNIWMVDDDIVYEAQLENRGQAEYHGYPLMQNDLFRDIVLKEWNERNRTI